jgi:uncharacterized membrane protein YccC
MKALRLRSADPGLFALKSAARAAIVMPAVFAFADQVIGDPQTATFSAFGSFAMLVLADFGGSWRARLAAYLALAGAGGVLIVLGTLCSRNPWLAAGAMALVGFAVLFSGVINGYFAAGGTAAMLAFVLPVNIAAAPAVIPARLAGWGLAAAAGICAQLLLWPGRPRDRLRASVAAACLALADLVESERSAPQSPTGEKASAAREAVAAVRQRFLATPYRPNGPTRSAQAIAFLVDELEWFQSLAVPAAAQEASRWLPCREENGEVMAAVAAVLRASAATLEGRDARPDLERLDAAHDAVADTLPRRIAELTSSRDDLELLAAVEPSFRMRSMSYSARQIGRHALLASGAGTADDDAAEARWFRPARLEAAALQASSTLQATERLAAEHASVRSVWFRNSVRGAAALAVAVLVAQQSGVQHAFWVVLGTLSVLRSNALGTGATILSALAGTAVGIVIGAAVVTAIGTNTLVLWGVLPLAVLLAAYAPRVISFAAGQAGFTLTLLILFNIIQPVGWSVGLVRIEDVAIGFAISLAIGVVFWPRGAAALMRDSLATAYACGADYVVATVERLVARSEPDRPEQAAHAAGGAARRLDDAFRQYLAERSTKHMALERVTNLVAGATRVRRTALSLSALSRMTDGSGLRDGCAGALDGELQALHSWYTGLGNALLDGEPLPAQHQRDADGRRRVVQCALEAVAGGDELTIRPALALLWASQHLDNLWRLETHLTHPGAEEAPPPASPDE